MFIASLFQFIFTKIDFISFSSFLSLLLSFIRNLLQLCPAPYALILSMLPLANKLYALSTHVPSTLADLVIKSSFVFFILHVLHAVVKCIHHLILII